MIVNKNFTNFTKASMNKERSVTLPLGFTNSKEGDEIVVIYDSLINVTGWIAEKRIENNSISFRFAGKKFNPLSMYEGELMVTFTFGEVMYPALGEVTITKLFIHNDNVLVKRFPIFYLQ